MVSGLNPFAAFGSVASGSRFVGRKAESEMLTSIVSRGVGSRALIGEPKIGKTSLAMVVYNEARNLDCQAIVVDVSTCGPEESIFDLLAGELGVPRDLTNVDRNSSYDSVRRWLLDAVQNGDRHVIIIDEFDSVAETRDPTISIRRLREIISNPGRFGTVALIVSRRKLGAIEQQIANLSTLEGVCPSIYLRPFDISETLEMAGRGWSDEPINEIARFAQDFSGGHPYLSEMVMYARFDGTEASRVEEVLGPEVTSYFDKLVDLLADDNVLEVVLRLARGEAVGRGMQSESLIQYGVCLLDGAGFLHLWTPTFADYLRRSALDETPTWTTDK